MGTFKQTFKHIMLQSLNRSVVVALSFVIIFIYAIIALNISFLNPIAEVMSNFSMSDKYYMMMRHEDYSSQIAIVDLTQVIERSDIAKVLEEIESCHPKVVGMDCVFRGEKDSVGDNALREVAMKYDNIVFSYRLFNEKDSEVGYTESEHSFFAYEIPVHEGITEMPGTSLYNTMRKNVQLGWKVNGEMEPSIVGEIANLYLDSAITTPNSETVNINFSPTHFDVISPDSIEYYKDLLYGRIVYFGTMKDQVDMHYTPLGKMPGVKLLAYATQTIVDSREVKDPPIWMSWIISFIIVYIIDLLQRSYIELTKKSKHPLVKYILGSGYILGFLTFVFITLLLLGTFLIFEIYKINISLKWALAAVAFLSTTRDLIIDVKESYEIWKNNKKEHS